MLQRDTEGELIRLNAEMEAFRARFKSQKKTTLTSVRIEPRTKVSTLALGPESDRLKQRNVETP